jgi:NTP pyrophosphatase (non-canonical NTP hydrolase)
VIKEFQQIRDWKEIRGIGHNAGTDNFKSAVAQFNRVQQEVNEILDAIVFDDPHEQRDAVGDAIVTLINLSKILGFNAEDGLEQAFGVIELRKGITTPEGDFVRYGKLSPEDQKWCDEHQGNPGNQYFLKEDLPNLSPKNFIKKQD